MAGTTGLEPAASAVTGQRSNQLNYVPTRQINKIRSSQCSCGFALLAYSAPLPLLPKTALVLAEAPTNFLLDRRITRNDLRRWLRRKQRKPSPKHLSSFSSDAKGLPVPATRNKQPETGVVWK